MEYRNMARNITISRTHSGGQVLLSSPFTMTRAEQQIVLSAMEVFDERLKREAEAEALSRLLAPNLPKQAP